MTVLVALSQVKEARRTLKKPQVEKFDCTRHKQKFWCYCCGVEVERNVTDDNMTVMYGGLLEHMATYVVLFKFIYLHLWLSFPLSFLSVFLFVGEQVDFKSCEDLKCMYL